MLDCSVLAVVIEEYCGTADRWMGGSVEEDGETKRQMSECPDVEG